MPQAKGSGHCNHHAFTRGGGVCARFTGMLGTGCMEVRGPAGEDVRTLAPRHSMDAPAPA